MSLLKKIVKMKITFPFNTVSLCVFFFSFLQTKSHWLVVAGGSLGLAVQAQCLQKTALSHLHEAERCQDKKN